MARYTRDPPILGERVRERGYNEGHYFGDSTLDSQLAVYSPTSSHTALAPLYGAYQNPHHSSGALIRSNVVEEPVVEHEHHHVHHHIDHGNVSVNAQVAIRPRIVQREYSYDDLHDRERRYGSGASLGSLHHSHRHNHGHHGHRHRGGAHSDIDLSLDAHRRRGHYDHLDEYAIIDVPAGTRRVTVDMREHDITWGRGKGVRRSRGLGGELWTEITKDLITREAIEEYGYAYEETEFFYYIFEYLSHEQIRELVDATRDIRLHRVRDIEYDTFGGTGRGGRTIDWERDTTRTEIIVEGGHGHSGRRRHRNRYYY